MANVILKLRCLDHRGEIVHTRWGDVEFGRDGLAELEVPEGDADAATASMRSHRPYSWLAGDHVPTLPSYDDDDDVEIEVDDDPPSNVIPPSAKKPQQQPQRNRR